MTALTTPLINLGPKLDEFLRRRPMTPEQAKTSREITAAGVTGLERNADGLIDLGPDGDDNGGRLFGALSRDRLGWEAIAPAPGIGVWTADLHEDGCHVHGCHAATFAHVAALAWLEQRR